MASMQCPDVVFLQLLSDESNASASITGPSNYQTQNFDQLGGRLMRHQGRQSGEPWRQNVYENERLMGRQGESSPLSREWNRQRPLRDLPLSMQEKRNTRDRQQLQRQTIGFWESWRQSQCTARRRLLEHVGQALSAMKPWERTLHKINCRSGMGVKAFFVLLRYLIFLNLFLCLLTGGFVQLPTLVFGSRRITQSTDKISVLDFFLGTGLLERSPVFYGFYKRGSLDGVCLNTPLFFLMGICSVLIFSLIMVVRRTVVGYKHEWMLGKRYSFSMSFKVFCGWDFSIQDHKGAKLKQHFIRNDLKLDLEEERFQLRESQRTFQQRVRLCLLRFLLNVIVLVMLTGSFYLVYYATKLSHENRTSLGDKSWILSLVVEYLSPITINLVNFVLPILFCAISRFEDYSLTVQVNITLVRSIFLKLACLGFFLFFLYRTLSSSGNECWENQFGKEMYKLLIFDFLACFANTFLVMFPRKLLEERYPQCCLLRVMGKQQFLITDHVLDLVYTQTVTWVGVFYCPLLPQICVLKLFTIFYVKKFVVLRCCEPAQRMFRGSSSSVLFHFVLLLGLLMAMVVLGINLNKFSPSSTCGPFLSSDTVFHVTAVCVDSLPDLPHSAALYLASEAFALPLILAEVIVLTSYFSQRRANQKAIERLKDMLVMCSADKQFLVKQYSTLSTNSTGTTAMQLT